MILQSLQHLDDDDLLSVASSCKTLRRVSSDPSFLPPSLFPAFFFFVALELELTEWCIFRSVLVSGKL